jgi:IS5 family transposase
MNLPDHAIEAAARTLFSLRAGPNAWDNVHGETRAAYRRLARETVQAALTAMDADPPQHQTEPGS